MNAQPNYYAIIPANVRYDKNLIPNAKLLYGEITALSNKEGYCWASTEYFQKLYGAGRSTIQSWLKSLETAGYISRVVVYKEGTKEIEKRAITILDNPSPEKETTLSRNLDNPSPEKETDNNTFNNTTNKDTMSGSEKIPYSKIIDHLNKATDSKFSAKASANQKLIKARWNEGNELQIFLDVIDLKNEQWKDNEKMAQYLRPSTLFGATNFENYKAEVMVQRKKEKSNFSDKSKIDYQKQQEELRKIYEQ